MKSPHPIRRDLIAPCGMNCAICSRYLAFLHDLKRSTCPGCRPRNTKCRYLFRDCGGPQNDSRGRPGFCFECQEYPCTRIDRMDKRYKAGYRMSIKENLESIRDNGISRFLADQYERHRCPNCSGLISTHNGKCFTCDTITRLVEKRNPVTGGRTPKSASPKRAGTPANRP